MSLPRQKADRLKTETQLQYRSATCGKKLFTAIRAHVLRAYTAMFLAACLFVALVGTPQSRAQQGNIPAGGELRLSPLAMSLPIPNADSLNYEQTKSLFQSYFQQKVNTGADSYALWDDIIFRIVEFAGEEITDVTKDGKISIKSRWVAELLQEKFSIDISELQEAPTDGSTDIYLPEDRADIHYLTIVMLEIIAENLNEEYLDRIDPDITKILKELPEYLRRLRNSIPDDQKIWIQYLLERGYDENVFDAKTTLVNAIEMVLKSSILSQLGQLLLAAQAVEAIPAIVNVLQDKLSGLKFELLYNDPVKNNEQHSENDAPTELPDSTRKNMDAKDLEEYDKQVMRDGTFSSSIYKSSKLKVSTFELRLKHPADSSETVFFIRKFDTFDEAEIMQITLGVIQALQDTVIQTVQQQMGPSHPVAVYSKAVLSNLVQVLQSNFVKLSRLMKNHVGEQQQYVIRIPPEVLETESDSSQKVREDFIVAQIRAFIVNRLPLYVFAWLKQSSNLKFMTNLSFSERAEFGTTLNYTLANSPGGWRFEVFTNLFVNNIAGQESYGTGNLFGGFALGYRFGLTGGLGVYAANSFDLDLMSSAGGHLTLGKMRLWRLRFVPRLFAELQAGKFYGEDVWRLRNGNVGIIFKFDSNPLINSAYVKAYIPEGSATGDWTYTAGFSTPLFGGDD